MSNFNISNTIAALWSGRVSRGARVSLAIRLIALGLGFFQAALTARLLGPEGYGSVAIAISISTLFAFLGVFGLGGLSVREIPRLQIREKWGALLGFLIFASTCVLLLSLAGGSAVSGAAMMALGGAYTELGWGILLVPVIALLILFRGFSQGFGEILGAQGPTELVRPIIMTLVLGYAFLAALQLTTQNYMFMFAVANVVALAVAVVAIARTLMQRVPSTPKVIHSAAWRRSATPFLAISILAVTQAEINTILLSWLSGPEETGLFQPILRLAPVMIIGIQAINFPLEPRISQLWEQGHNERLVHVASLTTLTTTAAVVAASGIILLLAPWLLSVFGKAFEANMVALIWIAAAQVFRAACGPVVVLLSMTGHQSISMYCQLAGLALNVLLGILLIPDLGAAGAAIAMSVSIVVWNVLMLFAVKRRLGFDPSIISATRRILISR